MPKPLIILGISPGTRSMGIAIWKDNHLSEWQIKAFKGAWTAHKLRDILFTCKVILERHAVTHLAIKAPDPFRTLPALDKLFLELQSLARSLKVKVKKYSLQDLKKLCSDNPKFTKAKLIRAIADQNDVLRNLYNRELKNRNPYYTKMFEAIALVLLTYQEYLKKHSVPSPFPQL